MRRAQGLQAPLTLAQLEISDARRLRATGQPQPAVTRLQSARQRLMTLGARPYMEICDRELAAADALAGPQTAPALAGLTPAEQAVARLVATGRSNRQAAAELYVSVKTVEFHLGHIFDKLGIRSRKDLVTRIGAPAPRPPITRVTAQGPDPRDTASLAGDDDRVTPTLPETGLEAAPTRPAAPGGTPLVRSLSRTFVMGDARG